MIALELRAACPATLKTLRLEQVLQVSVTAVSAVSEGGVTCMCVECS